jgi:hypothetical protein
MSEEDFDIYDILAEAGIEDFDLCIRADPEMFSVFGYFAEDERYRRALGKLLPHRIGQILEKMGFKVKLSFGQSNGVDIKVWLNRKLVLVIETKNYNLRTKITDELIENTITNLEEHPCCKKYFIYTQMANEEVLDRLNQQGIHILKIGYQLLPKWFYYSIEPKYRCYRKIDSSDTSREIGRKIYPMLHSIMLENIDQLYVTIKL